MAPGEGRYRGLVRFGVPLGTIGVLIVLAWAIGWREDPALGLAAIAVAAVLIAIGLRRSRQLA